PFCSKMLFACPLRLPLLQKTTMLFLFLNLDNWLGTLSNGMFTAPFTLPAENSAGVRTSTKKAPFFIASLNSLLSVGANRFLKIPNIAITVIMMKISLTLCFDIHNPFWVHWFWQWH